MTPVDTGYAEGHVTLAQAAKTLNCSVWTCQRLVQEYSLPCIRIGNTRLVEWKALLAARRMQKTKPSHWHGLVADR